MAAEKVDVKKYLKINMHIIVRVLSGAYEGTYSSRVEDYAKDDITIAVPTDHHGVPVPLLKKTPIEIDFILEDLGRLRFKSTVIARTTDTKIPFLKIVYPDVATREQLREFFRVPVRIQTKIYEYYEDVPDNNMKIPHKSHPAVVEDLSGGGGRIKTAHRLQKGDRFSVDFSEIDETLTRVDAEAVRVEEREEDYQVSFKIYLDKEAERNKIIRYVFKRQIELREMGAI